MKKRKYLKNEKGSVILWSIMAITLFFLIVSSAVIIVILEARQASQIDDSTQAYMAAESGNERAQNYIGSDNPTTNNVTGTLGTGVTYKFQVIESGSNYAGTEFQGRSNCANDFCYISQGEANKMVRTIEGSAKKISLDQIKSFLQGLPLETLYDWNTTLIVTPDSGVIASPTKFYLKWTVEGVNDIPPKSQCTDERCFAFGLFQNGVGSLDVNLEKVGSETKFYLSGNAEFTAASRSSAVRSSAIPSTTTAITFELTYHMGGATTLKTSDQDGKCIGVLVRNDLDGPPKQWGNMGSYYQTPPAVSADYKMFFARDATPANVTSGISGGPAPLDADGFGITLKSVNKTIKIRGIVFKVE